MSSKSLTTIAGSRPEATRNNTETTHLILEGTIKELRNFEGTLLRRHSLGIVENYYSSDSVEQFVM